MYVCIRYAKYGLNKYNKHIHINALKLQLYVHKTIKKMFILNKVLFGGHKAKQGK